MEYNDQFGVRGLADKTQGGTTASLISFGEFLETLEIKEITDALCCPKVFSKYGDYLLNYAASKHTGERLKPGTVLQYLSGVVNELGHRFRTHPLYKDFEHPDGMPWYKNLYNAIKDAAVDQCIKNGEASTYEENGISRGCSSRLGKFYFEGGGDKLGSKSMINAGFKCTELRTCNGRAIEMSFTTFEQWHWDEDFEELQKNWNQIKTHKESHMIQQPEIDLENNWSLCWYVWCAVFILLGGGGGDHRNLFFC